MLPPRSLRARHRSLKSLLAAVSPLEPRMLLSAAPVDGVGNNVENPEWGSTGEALLRTTSVEYEDGLSSPAGADRPSAREISNSVLAQAESELNRRHLTDFVWIWGQFLDHDLDLTTSAEPAEAFSVSVPAGDVHFDPAGTGVMQIGLNRSEFTVDEDGIRQQINSITAFLDGSVIYGSDALRAAALRTFEGGRLKTSDGELLPFNLEGFENAGGPGANLFLAGDIRANENIALTAMHTVWVREHNRIADEIAASDPSLSDEEIYQQARRIVTAELQAITYNEFLPALLGPEALAEYGGYDPSVNPGIANIFSTAAYRFGHTLLSPTLLRLNNDGTVTAEGNIALRNAFLAPREVVENGIDSLLVGASMQKAQELDTQIIDDVRNFLFGPPGAGGFDLASLNIQRGRDHGLPDYNQARVDLGLDPVTSFSQITADPEVQEQLEAVYGDVNAIDAWVGGLAEDHLPGSSLGELFTAVLVDQFERIRAGDRFWYQNIFQGEPLRQLERTTLADVIERNTGVTGLQKNVFYDRSVLYVRLADVGDEMTLRVRKGSIEVLDGQRNVIHRRSLEDVTQAILAGDNRSDERILLRLNRRSEMPRDGIEIAMGRSDRDVLKVHGRSGYGVQPVASPAIPGSITVWHSGIDRLIARHARRLDALNLRSLAAEIHAKDEVFSTLPGDAIDLP